MDGSLALPCNSRLYTYRFGFLSITIERLQVASSPDFQRKAFAAVTSNVTSLMIRATIAGKQRQALAQT